MISVKMCGEGEKRCSYLMYFNTLFERRRSVIMETISEESGNASLPSSIRQLRRRGVGEEIRIFQYKRKERKEEKKKKKRGKGNLKVTRLLKFRKLFGKDAGKL
jgi:hypothetical protein